MIPEQGPKPIHVCSDASEKVVHLTVGIDSHTEVDACASLRLNEVITVNC